MNDSDKKKLIDAAGVGVSLLSAFIAGRASFLKIA